MRSPLRALHRYVGGSLRRRLLVAVVLVYSVLIALLVWQLVSREGEHLRQQRLERAQGVAGILATSGAPWLLAEDVAGLDELVRAASSMKALRYAMYADRQGRVLAHTQAERVGRFLDDARSKSLLAGPALGRVVAKSDESVEVVAPVMLGDRWIGWAWVSISLTDLHESQRELAVSAAGFGAAALLLGLLIAYFTARSVTARLDDLASVADEFRRGDRSVRSGDTGVDEVAAVARGLNATLDTLAESERSLKEVQRIARLGSWCHRPSAPALEWSESVYELFGFDPSGPAPTFEQFRERLIPEHRELVDNLVAKPPTGETKSFTLTVVTPNGDQKICWAQAKAEICPDSGETILHGVCQDITDRENAAAQLRQAQKMEAVGQLTGGLAHDFNNLLAIVIGNLDLLEEQLADRPNAHECVEEALAAALRGSVLTRQLLAFSRRQPLSPQVINLNELATGVSELCRRTLGEAVEVRLNLAGDLWLTEADPAQVETAILNLVINARDAMPSGGEVVIETKNVSCDEEDELADVSPGDYSVISVSDTGHGMASEIVARAFEPFFTTKPVGKGSGLGLSMVYGFAQQSGGHLRIYSEPGHGTVVRLYLPRAKSAATSIPPGGEKPQLPLASDETILLVEDNEGVRRIVARQLRDLGYKVLPASNGSEALAVLDDQPAVDLLFTDIVMPGGMDGVELGKAATAKYPHLKVLYTSGFTNWAAKKNDPGLASLLTKPYRKPDLAAKLREVLDGEAPQARKAAG